MPLWVAGRSAAAGCTPRRLGGCCRRPAASSRQDARRPAGGRWLLAHARDGESAAASADGLPRVETARLTAANGCRRDPLAGERAGPTGCWTERHTLPPRLRLAEADAARPSPAHRAETGAKHVHAHAPSDGAGERVCLASSLRADCQLVVRRAPRCAATWRGSGGGANGRFGLPLDAADAARLACIAATTSSGCAARCRCRSSPPPQGIASGTADRERARERERGRERVHGADPDRRRRGRSRQVP